MKISLDSAGSFVASNIKTFTTMKKYFLMMTMAAFLMLSACGQSTGNVPENVKAAFQKKFPNATKVSWGKENSHEWEAEFKMNRMEYSANFDTNGNWMETEYEISKKDIPPAVKATLDNQFAGYRITESEVSETANGQVYEFLLKEGGEKTEVAITKDGTVLKQKNEEEDENQEAEEDDED